MNVSDKIICFDLDGTLIDVSEKYCWVHKKSADDAGLASLEKSLYWRLKRLRVPEDEILALVNPVNDVLFEKYKSRWKNNIESDEALSRDTLVTNCLTVLEYLKDLDFDIGIATMRRNEAAALRQMENLGIKKFAGETAIAGASVVPSSAAKISLFKKLLVGNYREIFIVGDTEADLLAARCLNATGIAACCGLRDKKILSCFTNNIIKGFSELTPMITRLIEKRK